MNPIWRKLNRSSYNIIEEVLVKAEYFFIERLINLSFLSCCLIISRKLIANNMTFNVWEFKDWILLRLIFY